MSVDSTSLRSAAVSARARPTRIAWPIALAWTVKVLTVSLALGYVAAILLFHWLDRLRAYRTKWLALTALVGVGFAAAAVVGRSSTAVLGRTSSSSWRPTS